MHGSPSPQHSTNICDLHNPCGDSNQINLGISCMLEGLWQWLLFMWEESLKIYSVGLDSRPSRFIGTVFACPKWFLMTALPLLSSNAPFWGHFSWNWEPRRVLSLVCLSSPCLRQSGVVAPGPHQESPTDRTWSSRSGAVITTSSEV